MGSAIIEVGIGLVLIYLILSIVITQINNLIVNVLNLRAENLRHELERLLSDENVRAQVLTHPMINVIHNQVMLVKKPGRITRLREWLRRTINNFLVPGSKQSTYMMGETSDVTYVDPGAFADVLIDIVIPDKELLRRLDKLEPDEAIKLLEKYIQETVQDTNLERTLETVLRAADSVENAKQKLGDWFNSAMGYAGDAFKRRVQFISFVAALTITVFFNIDTIHLAETLWNDPAVREAVVVAAERAATNRTFVPDQTATTGNIPDEAERVQATVQGLLDLRIPVGWEIAPPPADASADSAQFRSAITPRNLWAVLPNSHANWLGMFIVKAVGLLATTFAIMQGSDFWFNLLRNLTAQRQQTEQTTKTTITTTTALPPSMG